MQTVPQAHREPAPLRALSLHALFLYVIKFPALPLHLGLLLAVSARSAGCSRTQKYRMKHCLLLAEAGRIFFTIAGRGGSYYLVQPLAAFWWNPLSNGCKVFCKYRRINSQQTSIIWPIFTAENSQPSAPSRPSPGDLLSWMNMSSSVFSLPVPILTQPSGVPGQSASPPWVSHPCNRYDSHPFPWANASLCAAAAEPWRGEDLQISLHSHFRDICVCVFCFSCRSLALPAH